MKSRLERPDQGISYTEFSYMLLQAYDYLHLHDDYGCRLQIGGSDQWGNITLGLELIRKVRGADSFALTYPLLLRPDGTKYGKTESGAVWLDPAKSSPYEMYQFFVRTPDDEVGRLLRYFTFLSQRKSRRSTSRPQRGRGRERRNRPWRAPCAPSSTARPRPNAPFVASLALYSEDVAKLDEATLLEVFADAPFSRFARSSLDGEGSRSSTCS